MGLKLRIMNNEDFITYDIAVRLRKAGFDCPCRTYWMKTYIDKDIMNLREDLRSSNHNEYAPDYYSAPTLAQAQKWLREEKRWHVQVRINGCRNMFCVELWEMRLNGYCKRLEQEDGHVRLFDRYEDALSEGITETLRLIEEGEE